MTEERRTDTPRIGRQATEARELFGLQAHTTTRLAAELLVEVLASRPGAAVLDVGAGTGLLAAVAMAAGAARAACVERDAHLVATGRERHPDLDWIVGDALLGLPPGPFTVVVANLTDPPLRSLVPSLVASAGDAVIVAGTRLWQGPALRRALLRSGASAVRARARNGWCAYLARR